MLDFTTGRAYFQKAMLAFEVVRAPLFTFRTWRRFVPRRPRFVQGAVQVAQRAPKGAPRASLRAFPATLSLLHINIPLHPLFSDEINF